MKIKVKELGILKQAEFSLGDLTIICGENNTGKTYAAYALYGFLSFWKEGFFVDFKEEDIERLLEEGIIEINILEYLKESQNFDRAFKQYIKRLPQIFATSKDRFKNTEFQISLDDEDIFLSTYKKSYIDHQYDNLSIFKKENDTQLIIEIIVESLSNEVLKNKFSEKIIDREITKQYFKRTINSAIKEILSIDFFFNTFIASAERTGTAIFRKELNFSRNRLLEEISQFDRDPREILLKGYDNYALPIKKNLEFVGNLENISRYTSFIADSHPDLLRDFSDIIGGEYTVTQNDELYYISKDKQTKLSMGESSSAVRSLLDIGFYLKHIAEVNDLLIIDEPELNLHPENQRRIARLFARLVNIGVKVLITTHSDYIIKELNTLIMLNRDRPYLKKIAAAEGYQAEELLSSDRIKVYVAEEVLGKLDDSEEETRYHTLTPAEISPDLGIEVSSFDRAIETMNRIQEAIVWGEE